MKAAEWTNYGPPEVLKIAEIAKPEPKDNEVLIRIMAASVTAGDAEIRKMKIPILFRLPMRIYIGFRKPKRQKILGMELAGVVEAVGKDVQKLKIGDQVFGTSKMGFGGNAEFICLPEKSDMSLLVEKPREMSFEEAATLSIGGIEALHFIRDGQIKKGQHLLINGAAGSIGSFALQLAKNVGAQVTGVDSGEKLESLRKLGADHVIDYTREDFTKNGKRYDAIIDVTGKLKLFKSHPSLNPGGRFMLGNAGPGQLLSGLWIALTSRQKLMLWATSQKRSDLLRLKELVEAGNLRPMVDRKFTLAQIVEAHAYVDSGKKIGNVAITIANSK